MNDHDVLREHRIDAIVPEFDPALDSLYRQAVAAAKQYGWSAPSREEFEKRYHEEIAASRKP